MNLISQFIYEIRPNYYFARANSHNPELDFDRDNKQIHFSLQKSDASEKGETFYYKSDKNFDKSDSVKTFVRNL